jgi:hypothetical protein
MIVSCLCKFMLAQFTLWSIIFSKEKIASDYESLCWQTIQLETLLLRMLHVSCDKRQKDACASVSFHYYFLQYISRYD